MILFHIQPHQLTFSQTNQTPNGNHFHIHACRLHLNGIKYTNVLPNLLASYTHDCFIRNKKKKKTHSTY